MAENSGLIGRITTRMIEVSLKQLKEWMGQGFDTGIANNLSLSYLGSPGLRHRFFVHAAAQPHPVHRAENRPVVRHRGHQAAQYAGDP